MNASINRPAGSARADADVLPMSHAPIGAEREDEKTLLGIRQARDLVLGKNRELIEKLARAEDQIAELTYQRDDLMVARDVAEKKASELEAEAASLRSQISLLSDQQAALAEAEKVYVIARNEIEADLTTLTKVRDDALETSRTQAIELERLRSELETAHTGAIPSGPSAEMLNDTTRQLADAKAMHERFATEQRKGVAALATQLATTQQARDESRRELAKLVTECDALQSRASEEKAALETRLTALEEKLAAALRPLPVSRSNHDSIAVVTPADSGRIQDSAPPPAATSVAPPSDQDIRDAIGLLYLKFEKLQASPEDPALLAAFESALHTISRSSRGCGLDLIHHMTSAGGDYAQRLRATPAKLQTSAAVFEKAIEMLGWLGLRGRAEMIEIRGAQVYAVDDDVDNCECLAVAFEKVDLQTKYAVRPEVAIEQLAASPCDLIVLDVDLPGMDGFELHSRIRTMAAHTTTPIVFLSGHLSTSERVKLLGEDNVQFVAKPYNLSELTLRILTLIVEARLG